MNVSDIIRRTSAAVLAGLLLTACGEEPDFYDTMTITTYSSALPASGTDPVGTPSDSRFLDAVTNFSETFFRNTAVPGKNTILSPLSAIYALTLTANGAAGETLAEFNALNNGIDVVQMNEYLYSLTKRLEATEETSVNLANSVWVSSSNMALNTEFGTVAKKYYDADTSSVDFTDKSTPAIINDWVSDKTDGMIEKAVDEIDPMTALILINTILFDGAWAEEYEEEDVYTQPFTGYSGTVTEPDFLHSTEYSYFEVKNGAGFSKAYKDDYKFVAILPDEGTDVYDFVSTLDIGSAIDAAAEGSEKVICAMPSFEYETEATLNDTLRGMGLERAFLPGEADFSGLGKSAAGGLCISTVLQKAKITLNEHGTKAAAMTEVMVMMTSAGPGRQPRRITLDRPFFYMILDSTTDIPLFMGITAEIDG